MRFRRYDYCCYIIRRGRGRCVLRVYHYYYYYRIIYCVTRGNLSKFTAETDVICKIDRFPI